MGLVEQGQLDATVQDVPIAIHYGRDFPGLRRVGEPEEPGYYVASCGRATSGFATRSTRRSQAAIDDGTLQRIYEKYGVWNDDQQRLADVAKTGRRRCRHAPSRWANLPHYARLLLRPRGRRQAFVPLDAAGDAARPDRRDRPAVRPGVDSLCRSRLTSSSCAARRCCCNCS